MSFSQTRHHWYKVIVCAFAVAHLWGCASTQQAEITVDDEEASTELAELFDDFDEAPAEEEISLQPEKPIIPPVELIDEDYDPLDDIAAIAPEPELPQVEQAPTIGEIVWHEVVGGTEDNAFTGVIENRFKEPVAVSARSEYIYVVDQGSDTLYRVDQANWRVEALLDLRTEVKGLVADIYVTKDFGFFITDTEAGRVIQYDSDGDRVKVFRNQGNMVQPVSVSLLDNNDVLVADAHYDHLLRFSPEGELVAAYGGRGSGVAEFTNITAMALGPDGFYVGSRVGRKVQVVGGGGDYLYAFEEGGAIFPAAIVVNEDNRSYVADMMDSRIKVFERGVLVSEFGSFGSGLGQFKRISDLWLEDGTLYVADSLNGRIQMAKIFDKPASVVPANLPK